MITLCTGCHARYRLDASKVPERLIRVRCPACSTVFDLDGTQRTAPAPASPEASWLTTSAESPASTGSATQETRPFPDESMQTLVEPSTMEAPGVSGDTAAKEPAGQDVRVESASAVLDRPKEPSGGAGMVNPGRRRRREKNEMLARALVSDILVYNQATRDKALVEGTLLEALGPEIKKSWELYKEKVGPEAATTTTYFKDALNEILAEGQHVF
jgi:predicted Zn finger-like uncharacterized protein